MPTIKDKLLTLLKDQGAVPLRYREIGRRIGEKYPQTVKHHIEALKDQKLIVEKNSLLTLNEKSESNEGFLNLPFYGMANCGPATAFADDKIEGYIKISRNALPKGNIDNFYLVRASGNSMNKAKIGSKHRPIEDGDIVIVNAKEKNPESGDYIVSVIDGYANIKKFSYNYDDNQVVLISESTDDYNPIILHESDNIAIAGKIIDILKISNQK